jgi:xanthine/CO dehydrogenase XdhC/CoxF family maturation factor
MAIEAQTSVASASTNVEVATAVADLFTKQISNACHPKTILAILNTDHDQDSTVEISIRQNLDLVSTLNFQLGCK